MFASPRQVVRVQYVVTFEADVDPGMTAEETQNRLREEAEDLFRMEELEAIEVNRDDNEVRRSK